MGSSLIGENKGFAVFMKKVQNQTKYGIFKVKKTSLHRNWVLKWSNFQCFSDQINWKVDEKVPQIWLKNRVFWVGMVLVFNEIRNLEENGAFLRLKVSK